MDKAKALIELEQDFRKNLNDEKDSDHWSDFQSRYFCIFLPDQSMP
jgi:hypothetical protein